MAKIRNTNWFVGIASLIPGLGLYLLDKPQLAIIILGLMLLLFAIFWLFPSMITWFVFSITYLVQMAYSVALATSLDKDEEPNFPLIREVPKKFLVFTEIVKALKPFLDSDESLISAIVGKLDKQMVFVAVSDKDLLITNCSDSGSVSRIRRFPKEDIKWASCKIGEANTELSFEFEKDKTQNIILPSKMADQSKRIVNEFPGTWDRENSFLDGVHKVQKEQNRPVVFITSLLLFAFLALCMYFGDWYSKSVPEEYRQAVIKASALFPFSISFFVIGWFPFIAYVKQIKRERYITWTNVILSVSMLQVLFVWFFSLSIFGTFWLTFVNWMKQVPIK